MSKAGGLSNDAVDRATRCLRHRGSDSQRVWTAPDGRAALGHARLSIIDLRTGDQPIANETEQLRLVVNGEFYNFEQIREELTRCGHVFRTGSDSEIALHLYEDRGASSVHALRGEFAFAIWDERDGQLFAARDRFGIKPLYYTVQDGTFYLASEVKAFREFGIPFRWDHETLYDVHFVCHPPDRTLFAGIYQLPPGSYLLTDGNQVRVIPYWDWDFPVDEPRNFSGDSGEWIENIRRVFEDAIRLRLRADVPVGCYLSGGIDSSAVLGFAARLSPRPLRAYTLAFNHVDYDEADIAEEQARLCGAEFCRVDVCPEHLAEHFSDAIYHAERPVANAHAVAKYLLSRAVRDSGIKVVLTGEGGDEILAGYPEVCRDLLRSTDNKGGRKHQNGTPGEPQPRRTSLDRSVPCQSMALDHVERVLGYVPTNLEVWSQFGAELLGVIDSGFAAPRSERDTYRVLLNCLDVERQLAGRHVVNQSLYIWGKTMLPNYILSSLGDRMEMAHSVEGRLPFLDHYLAQEAARMPVEMKIRGTTEKFVLREVARPVVTDTVYKRRKHAFVAPPATLETGSRLYALVQDTLRGNSLTRVGIYDRAKTRLLLDSVSSMNTRARSRTDALLMWMMSLCLLAERMRLN